MQAHTLPALTLPAIGATILGGKFAGISFDRDGKPYGFALLPDVPAEEDGCLAWPAAIAWAQGLDADLPTRAEGALLFQLLKPEFVDDEYHWLNETCSWSESSAWSQDFSNGGQSTSHKSNAFRARAVRRFALESFSASDPGQATDAATLQAA